MLSQQDLIEAFARNVHVIQAQAAGVTHEESMIPLPFQGNRMNWVVGHIAVNRDNILDLLGEGPVLGAEGALYSRGSEELREDTPGVLPLEELLARLEQGQQLLAAALGRLSEEDLARPITRGERTASLAQRIFFLYFHETYHVGQTELLRQLAGKNDKVI